jgi:hypothetical protein
MPNFLCINSHVQDTGQENEWESIGEPRKPEDYVCQFLDYLFSSPTPPSLTKREKVYQAMVRWTNKNKLNITEMVDYNQFLFLWT